MRRAADLSAVFDLDDHVAEFEVGARGHHSALPRQHRFESDFAESSIAIATARHR
ncbi:hypothetical protein BH11ACT4_BH11ACT4_25100 [soil metagenome]